MWRDLAITRFAFYVDFGTCNLKRFRCVFGGDLGTTVDPLHAIASGPANSIAQNQADILIIIDWVGFVAGAKVKDFSIAAFPGATGAKNFAPFKPGDENNLIGRGHGEWFTVHFDILDFEVAINPTCDRMGRVTNPESLFFAPNGDAELLRHDCNKGGSRIEERRNFCGLAAAYWATATGETIIRRARASRDVARFFSSRELVTRDPAKFCARVRHRWDAAMESSRNSVPYG